MRKSRLGHRVRRLSPEDGKFFQRYVCKRIDLRRKNNPADQCTNCLNITECNNGKIEFLTQKENDAEMASVLNITEQNKDVSGQNIIFVTPEDVHDVQENRKCGKETISKAETTVSEREKERNLAELSIKELAALCVGYGPGTPFAAVGDRSDPSTIFDDEGKPMTTNSHPTGYPGICFTGN